jgi:hypothetical protein
MGDRTLGMPRMTDENTNWPRLYGVAGLIGAGFGLLLGLGALPFAPDSRSWGLEEMGPAGSLLLTVLVGGLVGVLLAGAAHLGVTYQLRRRS